MDEFEDDQEHTPYIDHDEMVEAAREAKAMGLQTTLRVEIPMARTKKGAWQAKLPILVEPFWEKQPGESLEIYTKYFVPYRDMVEGRSYAKLAEKAQRHPKYLQRLAVKYRWRERLGAFDVYIEGERRSNLERARIKANEENARIAKAIKMQVATRLKDFDIRTLGARDLINWFKIAAEVEALALGGPTSRVELDTPEMIQERRLRDAVTDVVTNWKLKPIISLEERAKWAAVDYDVELETLNRAIQTKLDAMASDFDTDDGHSNGNGSH
jgi:hypothetical protein